MSQKKGRSSARDATPKRCPLCNAVLTKASKVVTVRANGRQAKICAHHPAPESVKVEKQQPKKRSHGPRRSGV
jgi:hypothetical protein